MRDVFAKQSARLAQNCLRAFVGIAVYGIPVTLALMMWHH